MNILYINEQASPYSETFVSAEKNYLAISGNNVLDINLKDYRVKAATLASGLFSASVWRCAWLMAEIVMTSLLNYQKLKSNIHAILLFVSNISHMQEICWRADHIRAHHLAKRAVTAMLLNKLCNKSFSAVAHADDIYNWARSISLIIRKADFIHTISNYNVGYLNAKTHFRYSEKIHLIRNSFLRNDGQGVIHTSATDDQTRIFMACRFVNSKGILEWLDIFQHLAKMRSIRLEIAGNGPLEKEIRLFLAEHGLEHCVKLCGVLDTEEIYCKISNADFMVLCSKNATSRSPQMDGLPTVFFESLSLGIPVITTSVSGIPELVVHGVNGIVIDLNIPSRVNACKINEIMRDKAFYPDMIKHHFQNYLGELEGGKVLAKWLKMHAVT
jgi:glycosyltransferase involved in cell wall biosynthesis